MGIHPLRIANIPRISGGQNSTEMVPHAPTSQTYPQRSIFRLGGLDPGPASASGTTIQAAFQWAEEARALLRKQSGCREKALFFVGRSLRGAGAPLPAPSFQQRNKTAAICRFVSNSLRPWGGESRERGICEDSNGQPVRPGSPGSWPPSPPGEEPAREVPETKRGPRQ